MTKQESRALAHMQRLNWELSRQTLTPREKDVFALAIRKGCTPKKIAADLNIAVGTASTHLRSVLRKFGSENQTELMATYQNYERIRSAMRADAQRKERAR